MNIRRETKKPQRFIDEQPKLFKGKYHGKNDQWDREFNGHQPASLKEKKEMRIEMKEEIREIRKMSKEIPETQEDSKSETDEDNKSDTEEEEEWDYDKSDTEEEESDKE